VDITEKKINRQIQFWALVGPLITLLTFVVLLKKTTTGSLYLPILILIGFPICWKWKIRGFAISLGALFAFFVFSYGNIPIEDRFWQFGMGMAVTLSFAVTALSFEEVDALIRSLQVESTSRLTNLLHLDEKFKASEEKLHEDCEILKEQVEAFTVKLHEKEILTQRQEKLIQIVRNELLAFQVQHEGLLNELFQRREEVKRLQEQESVSSSAEVAEITQLLNLKEVAFTKLQEEYKHLQEETVSSSAEVAEITQLLNLKEVAFTKLQEEYKHLQEETVSSSAEVAEITELQAELHQLRKNLETQSELRNQQDFLIEDLRQLLSLREASLKQNEADLTHAQLHAQEKQLLEANLLNLQKEFETVQFENLELVETHKNKVLLLTQAFEKTEKELSMHKAFIEEMKVRLSIQEGDLSESKAKVLSLEVSKSQEIDGLQAQLKEKSELVAITNVQIQQLSNEKDALAEKLHQFSHAIPQDRPIDSTVELVEADRALRRIKGMYEQLKSQFHEKSTILDETRRQLFLVEEKLLLCQIESQEKERYEYSELEAELQKQLIATHQDSKKMYQEACHEIEALHEIIANLLQPA